MYNTPELLLVGAAQQLVLGESPALATSEASQPACNNVDENDFGDPSSYIDVAVW